jgi:thioredoxin-related protein
VSRLTEEWKNGRIIRVNLTFSKVNKEYAERLNVNVTPTFILFDAKGKEEGRWTSKVPTAGELP